MFILESSCPAWASSSPSQATPPSIPNVHAKIMLRGVHAILVGFADLNYACHALTPWLLESEWVFAAPRLTLQLYQTFIQHANTFTPYIPRPKGRVFTALFR